MLNDLVAEAVIHDQPFLRFMHIEAVIRGKAVFVALKHDLNEQKVFQDVRFVLAHGILPPFPFARFCKRLI